LERSSKRGEDGERRRAERRAEHFLPVRNEMGESPIWSAVGRVLYWLDAEGGSVYHWDPASAHWGYRSLETPVKALVRKAPRGFVALTEKGLFFWDADERSSCEGSEHESVSFRRDSVAQGSVNASAEVESPGADFHPMPGAAVRNPTIYYNGAAVDRRGRLLVNTYSEADVEAADGSLSADGFTSAEGSRDQAGALPAGGSLFRIEPSGGRTSGGLPVSRFSLVEIDRGLALPKGMCLSPDGRRLYLSEMLEKRILVYDYEAESGDVKNRRVFAEMTGEEGMPGGLAVDREGFLWCAHWGGWRVSRYATDGSVDLAVPLPVSIVTGVGFGGEGLDDLIVTTAFFGLSDEERESQPQAGDLFRVRTGTGGVAESEFMEALDI
jgi:sugar lactone lactonase YvrE